MIPLPLAPATALLLGGAHAFDADHLAAVTSYIARHPSRRAAAGFALRWALGHATALLAAGLSTSLLGLALPPALQKWTEAVVAVVLIGLGIWVLAGVRAGRVRLSFSEHDHGDHAHAHLHLPAHRGAGRGSVFWVGVLHGMAGSAALMVIVPIALMSSVWGILGYLALFSAGVTAAMAAYALAVGGFLGRRKGGAAARWYPWLAGAAGSCTVVVGIARLSLTLSA